MELETWSKSFSSPRLVALHKLENPVYLTPFTIYPLLRRSLHGFKPFPSELALNEKQPPLSKIWTRVSDFIFDDDGHIVVNEFDLQSRYYIYFRTYTVWKGMNPLIHPAMG